MAEENEEEVENQNPEAEGEQSEAPPKPEITWVTPWQWTAIVALIALSIYLYAIWPFWVADDDEVMKDPSVYLTKAEELFTDIHSHKEFKSKPERLDLFKKIIWNYQTAEMAGHALDSRQAFQAGYAQYVVADHIRSEKKGDAFLYDPVIDRLKLARDRYIEDYTKKYYEETPKPRKDGLVYQYDNLKPMSESAAKNRLDIYRNPLEGQPRLEKIRYLLGKSYLKIGNPKDSIKELNVLGDLRREVFNQSRKTALLKSDQNQKPPIIQMGVHPNQLQFKELLESSLLLGQARYQLGQKLVKLGSWDKANEQYTKAAEALRDYLESMRLAKLERSNVDKKIDPDISSRFQALRLLGEIYWGLARDYQIEAKKFRGANQIKGEKLAEANRKRNLEMAYKYIKEILQPEYKIFDPEAEMIKLAEIAYGLGQYDEVVQIVEDFDEYGRSDYKTKGQHDPKKTLRHKREMELWKVLAILKKRPYAMVDSSLTTIATSENPGSEDLKLAAFVILGDLQVHRGEHKKPLGDLVDQGEIIRNRKEIGAYEEAAKNHREAEFDANPFIDKLTLIRHVMKEAENYTLEAEQSIRSPTLGMKERQTAIQGWQTSVGLYQFLLKHFTIPRSKTFRQIGFLKRRQAQQEKLIYNGIVTEKAHRLFEESADQFLMSQSRDRHMQAADSLFEGGEYARAYVEYGLHMKSDPESPLNSKAIHQRGKAALKIEVRVEDPDFEADKIRLTEHRRKVLGLKLAKNTPMEERQFEDYFDRYEVAIHEFLNNIGKHSRPIEDDEVLPDNPRVGVNADIAKGKLGNPENKKDAFFDQLDVRQVNDFVLERILRRTNFSSRDYWAYQSLLELGNLYYLRHKSGDLLKAKRIYEHIMSKKLFTPKSEVWRLAAYQRARLGFDEAYETPDEKKDKPWPEAIGWLEDVLMRYDTEEIAKELSGDKTLIRKIQEENGQIKFLLAWAYFQYQRYDKSIKNFNELLQQKQKYILIDSDRQRSHAMLADAYFKKKEYLKAFKEYENAHDRYLDYRFERPLYLVNMANCLEAMGDVGRAIQHLERALWEIDAQVLEKGDEKILRLQDQMDLNKDYWKGFVTKKLEELKTQAG